MVYSNADDGITFTASSGTTTILGNYVGTNSAWADLGNADDGIYVSGTGTLTIGGTVDGAENYLLSNWLHCTITGLLLDKSVIGVYNLCISLLIKEICYSLFRDKIKCY